MDLTWASLSVSQNRTAFGPLVDRLCPLLWSYGRRQPYYFSQRFWITSKLFSLMSTTRGIRQWGILCFTRSSYISWLVNCEVQRNSTNLTRLTSKCPLKMDQKSKLWPRDSLSWSSTEKRLLSETWQLHSFWLETSLFSTTICAKSVQEIPWPTCSLRTYRCSTLHPQSPTLNRRIKSATFTN